MNPIKNKSLLEWFVSFGKTKGTILYLIFLAVLMIVFTVLHGLIFHQKFYGSISDSWFFILAFVLAVATSSDFYDNAIVTIKKAKELESKGLTALDISNIKFVKEWEEMKANGFFKYIFFNGGLIIGSILFIVVSFILFPKAKHEGRQFEELSDMMYYMLKCYIIGFLSGAFVCLVKWYLNERRFKRLTHPIR
jgi:hypothetical membrane protein